MGLANRQFVTTLTTLLDFHKSSTICAKSFCLRAKILLQSRTTANSNSPLFQTLDLASAVGKQQHYSPF
jgi:hypothetical protein